MDNRTVTGNPGKRKFPRFYKSGNLAESAGVGTMNRISMRASAAIGLFLVSSMSIFGIASSHSPNRGQLPSVEPVWVNGVMGVYDPDTGVFVPSTSPLFNATCEKIQLRRQRENGDFSGSSYSGIHHWIFYPGSNYFSYPGARPYYYNNGGSSFWGSGSSYGSRSTSSGSFSHSSFGSERGGIGSTGHSFGGGHGGE
jgi:hypothetical protein